MTLKVTLVDMYEFYPIHMLVEELIKQIKHTKFIVSRKSLWTQRGCEQHSSKISFVKCEMQLPSGHLHGPLEPAGTGLKSGMM